MSSSLLFPFNLSQTGDVFVLQDLRLLLRLKQSIRHHCFGHCLDWDGHGSRTDRRKGTEEFPGQPLSRSTLLPVYQQNPVGGKHKGIDDLGFVRTAGKSDGSLLGNEENTVLSGSY